MIRKVFKNTHRQLVLVALIFLSTLVLTACGGGGGGSDSYDTPDGQTSTPVDGQENNILISADTLKSWIDAGKVNSTSYENVIILQQSSYSTGHIPGAQEWAVSGIDRIEGPVLSGNMVLDGETMDSMMQERGIRADSTIVFMGKNSERIYFFFRYWGFPQSQLKILNGGLSAWTAAGNSLTTVTPVVSASDFSVSDLPGGLNTDVRASLNEMIIGVTEGTIVPFNTYAPTADITKPKITETLVGTDGGPAGDSGYVFLQGQMLGQVQDPVLFAAYVSNPTKYNLTANLYNADGTYKSKADMEAYLNGLGIDGTKPIVTFCRAGNLAASGFTPMDVVLDWDIMLYDGSWSQWGSLTNLTTAVPAGKLWALPNDETYDYTAWGTDDLTTNGAGDSAYYLNDETVYSGELVYNWDEDGDGIGDHDWTLFDANNDGFVDDAEKLLTVTVDSWTPSTQLQQPYFYEAPESPYDSDANTIENEDVTYWEEGPASDAPTSVSGSAGGC